MASFDVASLTGSLPPDMGVDPSLLADLQQQAQASPGQGLDAAMQLTEADMEDPELLVGAGHG